MGNQFIGIATQCLPLTGGTVSGSLNVSGTLTISSASELIMDLGSVTGGWARGLTYKLSNNITAGIGVYGTGNSVVRAFMGIGASPWTGTNALTVTASDVQYNGVSLARVNGSYASMAVGKADSATNATNAEHATYATSAGSATSATNATAATSATVLTVNNTEAKNLGRLQYFQGSGNATLYPSTSWWSLIRAQHPGYANGYWQELALGFTNAADNKGIKYRTNENGALSAWRDVALLEQSSGYYGFYLPQNNTYFRTPPSGLLPSVANSSGSGYVGTSGWPFLAMYAKNFYGNLSGNATTATSATNATNATNASNLAYFKCTSNVNVGADDVSSNAIGYVSGISLMGRSDGGLFKQTYSGSWCGEIFIDYRTGGLATRGKSDGTWTMWHNVVSNTVYSIPRPIGGTYVTQTSTVTGALTITLPVGWISSMMKFTVDIYDFATNQSAIYYISGYNYGANSTWTNIAAHSVGLYNSNYSNLQVRFCNNGGKPAVCIGVNTQTWAYPQVIVRDVFIGYSGHRYDYEQGWTVSFLTTYPTVQATVSNPANWYNAYNAVTAGSATNAQQLGGVAAANYINTGDTLILRGTV